MLFVARRKKLLFGIESPALDGHWPGQPLGDHEPHSQMFVAHRKSSLSAFNLHAPYFIGHLIRQAWARNIVAFRRNLLYGIQGPGSSLIG